MRSVSESPEGSPGERWWGPREIPDEGLTVTIGGCSLLVRRDALEWHFGHRRSDDLLDDAVSNTPGADFTEGVLGERRIVSSRAGRTLELWPRLADRAVVARPVKPLRLPAGERIDLFVGSPLFVVLRLPNGAELDELPLVVPTETWFGPSTVRGELCYAARTRAAVSVDGAPRSAIRALTRVTLVNQAKDAMDVERIRLPVTQLRLGWDGSRFVTDAVELERESDGTTVNVEIRELAKTAELLTRPRVPERSSWKHALSALWA